MTLAEIVAAEGGGEQTPAQAEEALANAVRPDILTIGDDMPVDVRIRLECARIAVKAAAHIGMDGIRQLAGEIEDFALRGNPPR